MTIHTIDCDTLESFADEPERWLDVAWSSDEADAGPCRPHQCHDRQRAGQSRQPDDDDRQAGRQYQQSEDHQPLDRFLRDHGRYRGRRCEASVDDHRRAARDAGHQLGRTRRAADTDDAVNDPSALGSDLIDIRRIEKAIERFGDRFLDRIFTETERRRCDRRAIAPPATPGASPPRRRCQGARHRVSPRRVLARSRRRQSAARTAGMRLTGGALRRLEAITPPGMTAQLDLPDRRAAARPGRRDHHACRPRRCGGATASGRRPGRQP